MHKRFFVLETRSLLASIMEYMDFIHKNNHGIFPPASKVRANLFIVALAEEYIANMAMYPTEQDTELQCIRALFGVNDQSLRFRRLIRRSLREPAIMSAIDELTRQLSRHIKPRTWTRWTVINQSGLLAVAEGKDHRVEAWEDSMGWVDDDGRQFTSFGFANPVDYIRELLIKNYGPVLQVPVQVQGGVHYHQVKVDDELAVAMCADVLGELYPQLEFNVLATPVLSAAVVEQLKMQSFESFRSNVICNVLRMFGSTYMSTKIDRNRRYEADFSVSSGVLTICESRRDKNQMELQELVNAYNRQDRLSPEETELVERWLMDNSY